MAARVVIASVILVAHVVSHQLIIVGGVLGGTAQLFYLYLFAKTTFSALRRSGDPKATGVRFLNGA